MPIVWNNKSNLYEQQEDYYEAINAANTDGKKENESVQDKLLALLKEDNELSAKSAAEKFNMSERQIQRLLKTMKDDGIIERSGSNRNGKWI